MAVYRKKIINISDFFVFSDNADPVDIVDIVTDTTRPDTVISEFVKSPGFFVYEAKFYIDTAVAKSYGIESINFDFYPEFPRAQSTVIEGASFRVPIETVFDEPTNLGAIADGVKYSPSLLTKVLVSDKNEKIDKSKILPTALQAMPTQKYSDFSFFLDESKASLITRKEDPAKILSAGKYVSKTPSNITGFGMSNDFSPVKSTNFSSIASAAHAVSMVSLQKIRSGLEKSQKTMQNNLLSDGLMSLEQTPTSNFVKNVPVYSVNIISKKREYTRNFFINKINSQGAETFYLKISVSTSGDTVLDIESPVYKIDHGSEIRDFLSNPHPPNVKILSDILGNVGFLITKTDPTLSKVKIVRITYNPNLQSFVEDRGTVGFGSEKSVYFEDLVENYEPNVITYRFIVVNADGSYGDFESVVTRTHSKVIDQRKAITATTPISIRASNKPDYIQILVDTLNDQVFSLRLLRQDLGLYDELGKTIKTIQSLQGQYETIVEGKKTTLEFQDIDVIPGRHYRYFAAYRIGTEFFASTCLETVSDEDESIIRIPSFGKQNTTAEIKNVVSSIDSSGLYTVNFNLDIIENKEIYLTLIDSLTRAGVSSQFLRDLQNDSQKLKEAAAFIVERVDRTTGRRVALGIFPPGDFFDNPDLRNKKKIQDLEPGKKYEYICKLCVRPPDSFLQQSKVGFVARSSAAQQTTKVSGLKFSGGIQALYGRLPSEKIIRDGMSIEQNFYEGQTGVELLAEISLPSSGAGISEVSQKQKKNYNLLTWSTSGSSSSISYFLVYVNCNGVEHLVGTVSSVGSNSVYKFRDNRFAGEVGTKKYTVKAVSTSNNINVQSSTSETLTESSVPLRALSGIVVSEEKSMTVDFSISDYKNSTERFTQSQRLDPSDFLTNSFIERTESGKLISKRIKSIYGDDNAETKTANSLQFGKTDISQEKLNVIENFKSNFMKRSLPSEKSGLINEKLSKVLPPSGFFGSEP